MITSILNQIIEVSKPVAAFILCGWVFNFIYDFIIYIVDGVETIEMGNEVIEKDEKGNLYRVIAITRQRLR